MAIEGRSDAGKGGRIRLGMIGGGEGAFIGAVHRLAARMDDHYDLVAGALSATPEKARRSGAALGLPADRVYDDFEAMAKFEAKRGNGIEAVAIVTPNHMHAGPAYAFLNAGIHVICDKPVTTTVQDAVELAKLVERTGLVFGLTHNYTGYPMVRQAREMIGAGELGTIRVVQVQYAQDWLATPLEKTGQKQAVWRTDPKQSGQAGCLGDIGTHAFNLAEFVTGLRCERIAAELSTFVPGRRVDDNVQMLLRFDKGARGMLWSSQVATGNENNLRLRVYGEKAGLEWGQEDPNYLSFRPLGKAPILITRAGPAATAVAAHASRIPSGHPEGYLEAFAQLYTDLAEQIAAKIEGRQAKAASLLVPTVEDGVAEMRFIAAAIESSKKDAAWVALDN